MHCKFKAQTHTANNCCLIFFFIPSLCLKRLLSFCNREENWSLHRNLPRAWNAKVPIKYSFIPCLASLVIGAEQVPLLRRKWYMDHHQSVVVIHCDSLPAHSIKNQMVRHGNKKCFEVRGAERRVTIEYLPATRPEQSQKCNPNGMGGTEYIT